MRKRKLTEATKKKISESMKGSKNHAYGKPLSSEHKLKISKSMLRYWESVAKAQTAHV